MRGLGESKADDVHPPRRRTISPNRFKPSIAFGTNLTISRFGTRNQDIAVKSTSIDRSRSPGSRHKVSPSPTRNRNEDASEKVSPEQLATKIEDEFEAADREQKRVAAHILWKRQKQAEFRKGQEAKHQATHREAKLERRRKKAAETEFKTWLKLRTYNKFAVKGENGEVVEIKEYPFAPHNTHVSVVHPKEWNERPRVVTKTVVKTCVDAAGEAHEYKYKVRVDPVAAQENALYEKQQNGKYAKKKSRKPGVPKQRVGRKKAGTSGKAKLLSSGEILDVSTSSIQT